MRERDDSPTLPLAWNGLRLAVPADWRPVRLGLAYLYFEDADGPAFELKWRFGAGRDGMEAALRALTPKRQAKAGPPLPDAWLDALADFELMSLSWRKAERTGLGAALFCPDCGMAAVFQAYGGEEGPGPERVAAVAAVLRSLEHHLPGPPAFALYGLSFTPPPGLPLISFTFVPGRFSLNFANKGGRLDVVRLAPADVILARGPFDEVAALTFGCDAGTAREPGSLAGCPAIWLSQRQGDGLGDVLARRLGREARLAVLRHDVAVNKLLGASLTSRVPVDRDWLARTAAGCVSL